MFDETNELDRTQQNRKHSGAERRAQPPPTLARFSKVDRSRMSQASMPLSSGSSGPSSLQLLATGACSFVAGWLLKSLFDRTRAKKASNAEKDSLPPSSGAVTAAATTAAPKEGKEDVAPAVAGGGASTSDKKKKKKKDWSSERLKMVCRHLLSSSSAVSLMYPNPSLPLCHACTLHPLGTMCPH